MNFHLIDLFDMRMAPFVIQHRQTLDRIRQLWSARDYSKLEIELEATEAKISNILTELRAARLEIEQGEDSRETDDTL